MTLYNNRTKNNREMLKSEKEKDTSKLIPLGAMSKSLR